VLAKVAYQDRPARHDYLLTEAGRAFLPVLVALQDWGDQWVLGDGALSATSVDGAAEVARVHDLVGQRVPDDLLLPSTAGGPRDVLATGGIGTVVFGYPATGVPTPLPEGWSDIPAATKSSYAARNSRFSSVQPAAPGMSDQPSGSGVGTPVAG